MKHVPLALLAFLAVVSLPACGSAPSPSSRKAAPPSESASQLDPETLVDTISTGEQVAIEDFLPDDETIPTVVYFTADW